MRFEISEEGKGRKKRKSPIEVSGFGYELSGQIAIEYGHIAMAMWQSEDFRVKSRVGSAAVAADDTLDDALDLAELDADGFEVAVGGLKADVIFFFEEGFECG